MNDRLRVTYFCASASGGSDQLAHRMAVQSVVRTRSGCVLSGGRDATVRAWTANGEPLFTLPVRKYCWFL